MKLIVGLAGLVSLVAAQAPVQRHKDGALDRIELFVAALETPQSTTVAMKPFDASLADLGTGGNEGKQTRQEEAKTMQAEGPRVLAERFATALTYERTLQAGCRAEGG